MLHAFRAVTSGCLFLLQRGVWVMGLTLGLQAADSPGKFHFQTFTPAAGQDLNVASRPVANGHGGFWFLNQGAIWQFNACGYRPLGKADGFPEAQVDQAHPETSSGMWFHAGGKWYHLDASGLKPMRGIPEPSREDLDSFFAIHHEGFAAIREGRLLIFTTGRETPDSLPSPGPGRWTKGWRDRDSKHLLVVGDAGLARWDGNSWRVESLKGKLSGRPWDIVRDHRQALWVRSDRDLLRIEPHMRSFGSRLGFTRNSFVSLELDGFGRVWTNGPEGLACVDGDDVWRLGEQEGLYGSHAYWPIAFDAQGSLWTISSLGFQALKGGFLWRLLQEPHGLPRAMIFTTRRLESDHALYAGTHDGLFRQKGEKWAMVPGTKDWALFSMIDGPQGEIWACGNPPYPGDVSLLRIRPGQATPPGSVEGYPAGVWSYDLMRDDDGSVWCGTTKGLYHVQSSGGRWVAQRVPLPGQDPQLGVYGFLKTADGGRWAISGNGLFQRQGSAWTLFGKAQGLLSDDVTGAFPGPQGELWVCHPEGISRLKKSTQGWSILERMEKDHPLAKASISDGWSDPHGVVWMLSGRELVRWDGHHAEHHTKAFGLPIDNVGGIWGEPDGRMWIGSISGLTYFDPRFYRPIPPPPAVAMGAALGSGERSFRKGEDIPYQKSGVAFHLQLPLMEGLEDLSIHTRMVGLDEEWRPLVGNELRVPAIPAGDYTLEARAVRRDGMMGPTVTLPFRVLPPWYARLWAKVAWGVLGLLAIAGLLRWRWWALEREKVRLAQLVDERTSALVTANESLESAL